MKVLLTGGNGFLGKIIKKKIENDCQISTLGRIKSNYCIDLSLTNQFKFTENFELVIHCAGKAHMIPKNFSEIQEIYNVNVNGTANLLKALETVNIPKQFVFISSVAVYGITSGNLINENFPLLATDPYGLSKIKAEELIVQWCTQNKVTYTILRLPLLAGANPPGNLGTMIKGIEKGYYFNVAGGMAKKSIVFGEDVAKNILKVAEIGGIYNLTDGYHPSFSELSNHIAFQLGKGKPMHIPIWFAVVIAKFGDLLGSKAPLNTNKLKKIISDLTFDDSKARKVFGWNPKSVLLGFL